MKNLEELCNLAGVSGFEDSVADYLSEKWQPYLDSLSKDGVGNLYGIQYANLNNDQTLNVLIMAHMDEVGLIVRDITHDGYIHFDVLGGQVDEALSSQIWEIHTPKGKVTGYSGMESGHTLTKYPPSTRINQHEFFIDVGAESKEDAIEMGIRPGLPITYAGPNYIKNGTRILAKSLDDRFGLAMITTVLEVLFSKNSKFNLLVAATTQEELGMRGTEVLFNSLPEKPDLILNLDIGLARDYPLLHSQHSDTPSTSNAPQLGKGLTITTHDSNMIANPKLVSYLISLCENNAIKYQLDNTILGSTDACRLQRSGQGIPSINIGIPVRYAHSHLSMMDTDDYLSLSDLLNTFCDEYNLSIHNKLFPKASFSKKGIFGKNALQKVDESELVYPIEKHYIPVLRN